MGCNMNAFYDIDQEEIEKFIIENQIDTKDEASKTILIKHFYEQASGNKLNQDVHSWQIPTYYFYNKDRNLHVLYESHGCKCIRDHELLRYDAFPPPKYEIPWSITMWSSIRNPENAMDTATDLRKFFSDDYMLMQFADWLERTSKYCYAYSVND